MDSKLTHNPLSEKLTFRKETIEHQIDLYNIAKNRSRNLQFFIGLLITLIIALLSTNTTNLLNQPTPTQWFLTLAIASIFGVTCWKTFIFINETEKPIDGLKQALYTTYINKPDVNSLFIIKRINNNKNEILVYEDTAWECYFLPYKGIREAVDDIKSYSRFSIESILDLPKDSTDASMLLEQHEKTEKYHPTEKVVKEYHSFYFHLSLNKPIPPSHPILNDYFTIGEKKFTWKTLNELEENKFTALKNGDVIRTLRENNNHFISDSAPFIK